MKTLFEYLLWNPSSARACAELLCKFNRDTRQAAEIYVDHAERMSVTATPEGAPYTVEGVAAVMEFLNTEANTPEKLLILFSRHNIRLQGNGSHLYEIEIRIARQARTTEVSANNRTIAAKRAEKAGYSVFSVNMVG